ncbi:hypothetical protein MELA_02671 [Candidatus Methylomirabilis lanthanidiphila]|uniref:Uncharacterized protein n=1 Tax=Candidatus Methylomirabilis lanthanidiphila TaxID=2211376 RepID=A0A564ZLR7_9BACT|nr:hypothetical protein MELA_02671 [Candidatus Methylomirabilis lanthanidiphila]
MSPSAIRSRGDDGPYLHLLALLCHLSTSLAHVMFASMLANLPIRGTHAF